MARKARRPDRLGQLLQGIPELVPVGDEDAEVEEASGRAANLDRALPRALEDVAPRFPLDQERRKSQRSSGRAREALSYLSDILLVVDAGGHVTYASPSADRALGATTGAALGRHLLRVVHPEDRTRALHELGPALVSRGQTAQTCVRVQYENGSVRHIQAVASNLLDEPSVQGVVLVGQDVTERLRHEQVERAHARVLELIATSAPLAMMLEALADWVTEQIAEARCTFMLIDGDVMRDVASHGFPPEFHEAVDGLSLSEQASPCVRAATRGHPILVGDLFADEQWQPFHDLARSCGVRSCWSFPIRTPHTGELLGSAAVYRPVESLPDARDEAIMARACHLVGIAVERQELLTRLAYEAQHDPLTGLPNRNRLLSEMDRLLHPRGGKPRELAVLFLDLDRLKVVNDSLGHDVGDQLLEVVAERLRFSIPDKHLVARFGGDEFVVLAQGLTPVEVIGLTQLVLDSVACPVMLAGREITPSASVGVVRAEPGQSASDLLRDADIAMYRAKNNGGSRYAEFGTHMRQRAFDRLDLEGQLRRGLDEDQFRLFLQPVVDLVTEDLVGYETLVRWEHPERGLLDPIDFIAVAEETGLIIPLGEWVLRAAVGAVEGLDGTGLQLAVNVSAAQLESPALLEAVRDTCSLIAPWSLCLEITESTVMKDTTIARALFSDLAALGVELSIDDFGTGFSSLSYLTRLPFAALKLDRSFVGDLGRTPEANAVAETVIRLGHGLGLRVVAEGVETVAQHEVLKAMGCRFAQGYLFGRPVRSDDFAGG